jgi:hypothetical protein
MARTTVYGVAVGEQKVSQLEIDRRITWRSATPVSKT